MLWEAMRGIQEAKGGHGRTWEAMEPCEATGGHGSPWESMGGGDGHKQTEILVVETIGGEGCN
jgi:hypothetical protein